MAVVTPGQSPSVSSVVDLIGNTPLIRLSSFEAGLRNVELYAKAEWRNPGDSAYSVFCEVQIPVRTGCYPERL